MFAMNVPFEAWKMQIAANPPEWMRFAKFEFHLILHRLMQIACHSKKFPQTALHIFAVQNRAIKLFSYK